MLKTKEVEVNLNGANISYYKNLGYEIPVRRRSKRVSKNNLTTPKGTKLIVKVEHLPKGSDCSIDIKCDYCGKIFSKTYQKYLSQKSNPFNKKDCCYDCRIHKNQETMKLKYNLTHNSQLPEVKQKISEGNRADEKEVDKLFEDLDYIKLSKYKNYSSPIEFICKIHESKGVQTTNYATVKTYGNGCWYCRYEKISKENYYNWKGGVTNLNNYLRSKISGWKFDSLKSNHFKCVLTGENSGDLVIHHLYSFAEILKETLLELNIDLKENSNLYTDEELNIIIEKFNEIHYRKGLGIPIIKKLHDIYHANYGNLIIDNGEFEEFKQRYFNGEFKDVI